MARRIPVPPAGATAARPAPAPAARGPTAPAPPASGSSAPAPPAPPLPDDAWLPIGELARRAGVAASALRFYEDQGLLAGGRSAAGRRQYPRHALRRVAFIRAAQAVGLGLADVRAALASLPDGRTPTAADWQRLGRGWQPLLDARIAALTQLRAKLAACIGCGCLSLKACALYNPADQAAQRGAGARYLVGDAPVLPPATANGTAKASAADKPGPPRRRRYMPLNRCV